MEANSGKEEVMFSRDEQIWISAVRYALGKRTYIVKVTVDYMIARIPIMSPSCREIMIEDIEDQADFGYGDRCDREEWLKLLSKLKESLEVRKGGEADE